MATKSKATLVAAFVLVSASAVLADNAPYTAEKDAYVRNPNAPVPHFLQAVPVQPRGLIEGRNVGVTNPAHQTSMRSRASRGIGTTAARRTSTADH